MDSKSSHERRQHAMRVATGFTAFALFIWVTTLGVRFALTPAQIAQSNGSGSGDAAQTASVVQSQQGNATLIVATTTYSNF